MQNCKPIEVISVMAPEYLSSIFFTKEKIQECVKGFEKLGFPQCLGEIAKLQFMLFPQKYNRNWVASSD